MFVPFHGDGIISQFEGYESLTELDWDHYREQYGNIQRLDRILRAEGDDPNRYKISKQADTVMLFYLFTDEELHAIFTRLGYEYRPDLMAKNVAYYDRRTSHGSTLSVVTHAAVLARLDPVSSWQRFLVALESDVGDVQGGTTEEGIHLGVMAATLWLVHHAYAGVSVDAGVLRLAPRLPDQLGSISFRMQFDRTPLHVSVTRHQVTLAVHAEGVTRPISVKMDDAERELRPGERCTFDVRSAVRAQPTPG
jgi:trehalose/maltose hydrolase-like predicted phosphorylase